jgi:hypothetical protein
MPEEQIGLEDITSLLDLWKENNAKLKELSKNDDTIRVKIRIFMKEKKWEKYNNPHNKINVSIIKQTIETIDTSQLKMLLDETRLAQIKKVKVIEKMFITTSQDRERMKKNMQGGKQWQN